MAKSAVETPCETKILVPIHLPAPLLASYQEQAALLDVPVSNLIASRLAASLNHGAQKPLYFDDDQRRALESLLCRNVSTSEEVISEVRTALSVSIGDLSIHLPPNVLLRMRTRFFGQPNEWDKFVRDRIVEGLEEFVGLR